MTPQEFKELIRPIAEHVLQETWEKDTFITCPDTDTLVQEFKDHSELVRIDDQGKAVVIKQLTDERSHRKTTDNRSGASLLWQLFREGILFKRGFFLNLKDFKTQPLKVA